MHKSLQLKIFILILTCLFSLLSYGQLPVKNYYNVDKDYIVIESSVFNFFNSKKDSLTYYKNSALKRLKNSENKENTFNKLGTYHYLMNVYKKLNQADSALYYLYKSLELPKVKSSKGGINIYWEIFRIYSNSENYVGQLEQIKPLQKLGEKHNFFKDTEPKNLKKINADVLAMAGYYKEASEYYTKYLINDSLAFDPLRYAIVSNDLACIYENLNLSDSVKKYRKIAFRSLKSKRPNPFEKKYTNYIKDFIKLHDIWYKKEFTNTNLKFAESFLNNAIKNYLGETHTAVYTEHFLTTFYFKNKEYKKALLHVELALKRGNGKLSLKKTNDLYLLKSRIYDKLDLDNLAYKTISEFNSIKTKKLAENRILSLTKYQVNELKKQKEQAEKLVKINEIKSKNITYLLILISIILFTLTILFIITRRKNHKIKTTQNVVKLKLKEKEFLLKELNHRVKNNLALIISLVRFQHNEINEKTYKDKFKSLEQRIITIASAHDELLHNEENLDGDNYDTKEYLTKTINSLIDISPRKVQLHLTANKIKLNIDTVLPLGLLINELVSNSIKHAVCDDILTIHIKIKLIKNKLNIQYKDNGKHFKVSENKNSLGLLIINSMIKQLKGTIQRVKTEYTISLQLKNSKE